MEGKPTYCHDSPIGVHIGILFKVCFSCPSPHTFSCLALVGGKVWGGSSSSPELS